MQAEFRGTARFRLDRKLGAGGMGVVYAAYDQQRGESVALKTLFRRDSMAVSHLKREFRALADVTHPNLVGLYELVADRVDWFYTMELVEGTDFLRAVRRRGLDANRLRHVLGQVAEGLAAIHSAGKLHRDLKPSNVLVTDANRAVILDFGIVAELETQGRQFGAEEGLVGTLAYMAPEQIEGRVDEASDWYAVGVMLYQALTGRLPYSGDPYRVMLDKRDTDPEPPDALVPDLPEDLVALARALMSRDPAGRPDAQSVLSRLGRRPRPAWALGASAARRTAIVGREIQVAALEEALRSAGRGRAVVACVHGSSGCGKSALSQWFLRHRVAANAVVLQGRCYLRESMPYKALDGVVEDLSGYLRSLSSDARGALIPPNVGAAARLFPILDWLEDEGQAAPVPSVQDPIQLRRHGFGALRELLRRLAIARPVVICIDDLQWGDAESVLALEGLLRHPDEPGILLIASFRTEDIDVQPFLRTLVDRARRGDDALQVREVALGPLADAGTRELALSLLVESGGSPDRVDEIIRESRGEPFLVELLARYVAVVPATAKSREITVEEMIEAQIRDLPEGCRAFLEVVTVAARPIDVAVARQAARVDGDERRLVGALQGAHLLRPSGSAVHVELYHDRIRETLAGRLPGERLSAIHLQLAQAMEARGIDEPETLCEHYLAADQRALAAAYAARAAESAAHKLAFERSAALYRRALDLSAATSETAVWQVGLADALANAGRGVEAATAYLSAAEAPGADAAEMRRLAADHLLRCGRIEDGLAVINTLADSVGLGVARSRPRTIARVLWRRAWLRLRGLGFTERREADIESARLLRIDMCVMLGAGLARVDGIRAADYQSLAMSLALSAGEPVRVARTVAAQAAFRCLGGGRTSRRTQQLLATASSLADRLQQPYLIGLVHLVRAMAFLHSGQFAPAIAEAEKAETVFRQQCLGVWREIDLTQAYTLLSLYYLGDLRELARRVPSRLQEANDHDDRYAAGDAIGRPNILWLSSGDVAGAREALSEIRQPDAAHRVDWPDWLRLFAETQVDLYAGSSMAAWTRAEAQWPRLARTTILWVQSTRIEAHHLRARCALAAAAQSTSPAPLLQQARRDAKRLGRERMPWSNALADLISAAIVDRTGGPGAATSAAAAIAGFEASGMALYAAAARRRYGVLLGGSEGGELVASADAWMAGQGIVAPERMTAVLAPGFRD